MIEKILVLLVVAVVMLVVFGNRLPQVMGDLGKGVKAFKDGMNEAGDADEDTPAAKRGKPVKKPVKKASAKAKK